jgi:peptidoglycan/xylan/chitin deacetylase (PgdA/CDA1 family)
MLLDDFREQARVLPDMFEMATMSSALEFLKGTYHPRRDLCLMTFDDGLKEHYTEVTPILEENGIQGVFFLISSCIEEHLVAPVHMNHFLMASLGFDEYRKKFRDAIRSRGLDESFEMRVDSAVCQHTYPLDTLEIAHFKYLFNFVLPPDYRDRAVRELFRECIGGENEFARDLYLSWSQAREMQQTGMSLGGHTHEHRPLSTLGAEELKSDLTRCRELMDKNLNAQGHWPFSYPYGKADSFNDRVIRVLGDLGYDCSLCTERGMNVPGTDLFAIRRVDCKEITSLSRRETTLRPQRLSVPAGGAIDMRISSSD